MADIEPINTLPPLDPMRLIEIAAHTEHEDVRKAALRLLEREMNPLVYRRAGEWVLVNQNSSSDDLDVRRAKLATFAEKSK
jgi:hypothetical protein